MDLLSSEAVRCYGWKQEWGKPRDKTGSRNSISERESWENEASIRGNNDPAYEVITDAWGRQPWAYIHLATGGIFLVVDHFIQKGVCGSKSTKGRVPSASKGELLHLPKAVLASKGTCALCLGSSKRGRLVQALHLILKVGTTCHK